jgi:hypothetical protein
MSLGIGLSVGRNGRGIPSDGSIPLFAAVPDLEEHPHRPAAGFAIMGSQGAVGTFDDLPIPDTPIDRTTSHDGS